MRVSLLGLAAVLAGLFLPAFAHAQTPLILSLSFDSTFPSQFIGTTLTVDVTAIYPQTQISVNPVTFTVGTNGSVTLNGTFSGQGISASTPLFISDGQRTWEFTSASGSSVVLDNAALLSAGHAGDEPLSWVVADYSTLFNSTFQAYVGTLITGATAGTQVTVDVGQFAQLSLFDNGLNSDHTANDGIWTGLFTVPNNGTEVTNANFYGFFEVADTASSNQDFQSIKTCSFDMKLPEIVLESSSTTNSNYNGDLYLSTLCQGWSAANPANVIASSAQAQFNFTVNKPNTIVDVSISSNGSWSMVTKNLPSYIFANNAASLAGQDYWSGDDGNQNFVYDGIYTVTYNIHDTNGLYGIPVTSQIKVVSLKLSISNITLTPPSIPTAPVITNGSLTDVNYTVSLTNDSADYVAMNKSLEVLGWKDAGQTSSTFLTNYGNVTTVAINGINSVSDAESTIWTYNQPGTLSAGGAFTPFAAGTDSSDWDTIEASFLYPFLAAYSEDQNMVPESVNNEVCVTSTAQPNIIDFSVGTTVISGDGDKGNDWLPKGFNALGGVNGNYPLYAAGGFISSLQPATISAQDGYDWYGSTPAQGNYRLDLQSTLTGLAFSGTFGSTPSVVDACAPTAAAAYVADAFHFWPQTQQDVPSGVIWGTPQGDAISTQNTSAIFSVQNGGGTTSDNTPPQYISSNPPTNGIEQPEVYSASNPLWVQFQDLTTAFNTAGSVSYATLTGPNGITIGGSSSTNGGSISNTGGNGLVVYFYPSAPIVNGGNYTLEAFTCNSNGLCAEQTVPFSVFDTASPEIQANGVVLFDTNNNQYPLSLCQSGVPGPYQDISKVSVSIQMPPTSKNTIEWGGCSVSLYQVSVTASGDVKQPVNMTLVSTGSLGTQGTMTYQISPAIDSAGLWEVDTFTESVDSSLNLHPGPALLSAPCSNNPQFSTAGCLTCVSLLYPNQELAISGETPITITSSATGLTMTTASVEAVKPTALPAAPGYDFLQSTNDSALGFEVNASGSPLGTSLAWSYPLATPVDFTLYYNSSDLGAITATAGSSAASDLVVLGYNNGSWSAISGVNMPTSPTASNNACSFQAPNGATADIYYALAYAQSLTNTPVATGTVSPASTPTAISLPNTRAFDPWNSNPLYQKARFYYSSVAPATMEARVYDTSGRLIRDLTLGNGISATQTAPTDTMGDVEYYFTWDGTNDSGTVVHNGIYLVRWTESGIDGSHNTQTRPVALIK
ncbi:MAG TPA: choice-of-anchor X domain-containing protein [bacterium]|nr:choice-of-anchor X domain-containing protein [bacterium]